jgi:hypothetical protein
MCAQSQSQRHAESGVSPDEHLDESRVEAIRFLLSKPIFKAGAQALQRLRARCSMRSIRFQCATFSDRAVGSFHLPPSSLPR